MNKQYDIAVIGGGPAGYTAALTAARQGAAVVLFEKEHLGGVCTNRGCVPMKTYLATASALEKASRLDVLNIRTSASFENEAAACSITYHVDMAGLKKRKDGVIAQLRSGIEALLRSSGVAIVPAEAKLEKVANRTIVEETVACSGGNSDAFCISAGEDIYSARRVILCCGSRPMALSFSKDSDTADAVEAQEASPVLTDSAHQATCVMPAEDLFALEERPDRLVLIGGGVVGCEMAAAYAAFGTAVTIVECAGEILTGFDKDIQRQCARSLKEQGVDIRLNMTVTAVNAEAVILSDGQILPLSAKSLVAFAAGRRPVWEALGIFREQVMAEDGRSLVVSDYLETTVPGLYVCGDMTGRAHLAHEATAMGEVAAAHAVRSLGAKGGAGNPISETQESRVGKTAQGIGCVQSEVAAQSAGSENSHIFVKENVPVCLYVLPEMAGIGLTEQKARERGGIKIGKFPLTYNARAMAEGGKSGFVKVIADEVDGRILGVHMVGDRATDLIAEAKVMMDQNMTIFAAAAVIHPHPTYAEALYEACRDAAGMCLNLPLRRR
ncbi:MAG: FAD-dependent oxidoreductase [Lachnospiraceae bacterium]|nr:FAD-dependent oxidoreductase [Lachnospiraceae bacterium]